MKYTLHNIKDHDDSEFFFIVEEATKHVINAFLFKDEADKYYGFLNSGGAFNGFTPEFVLKKIQAPSNLNVEFQRLLEE